MTPRPTASDLAEIRRLAEAKLAKSAPPAPQGDSARLVHELQVHQIELELQNEALQASQLAMEAALDRYTDLYDFAPAGYFTLASNGTIRKLNLAGARLLGTERAKLVGSRFGVFVAEANRAAFQHFLDQTFSSDVGQTCDVELAIEGRPTRAVTIEATHSADGDCRAVVTDITERKQAEEELRASEARFRRLVDAVTDYAIFLLDPEGRVVTWNAGAQVLKGYTADEIVGRHFSVLYPADERGPGRSELELKIAAAEGRFEEEAWHLRKDGSLFWANVVMTPVRTASGTLVSFARVMRDLSERKAAERRFTLVESAPDGIILVDRGGRIIHANPQATTLFGYPRGELVGRSVDDLVPERARAQHRSHRASFAKTPTVRPMGIAASSVRGLRKDGTVFPVEISLSPQETPEGMHFVAFIRDVTDLRRLQREQMRVAERVARLQAVTAALGGAMTPHEVTAVILSAGLEATGTRSGAVMRTVANGRELEYLGDAGGSSSEEGFAIFDRISGAPAKVVAGRRRISIEALTPICDAVRLRTPVWLDSAAEIHARYPAYASLYDGMNVRAMVCLPLVSRDEPIGGLRLAFSEARTFDGDDRAFLISFAEQCALALDRAQLYADALVARELAERAASMRDEFLSIVAHDLANPMNAIGLRAASLIRAAPGGAEGDAIRTSASKIQQGVNGMALLLQDLGDVASIDAGHLRIQMQEHDAAAIVDDAVDAFALVCTERGISITGHAPALRLSCDPHRVQQALGNLIANAIKFTPKGGKITVAAVPSGGEVRFSVADTGPGIAEEARAHVFERYWRGAARELTKGLGLGLFITKGIVDAHGGKIWVESVVGQGATFAFTLPTAPPTP